MPSGVKTLLFVLTIPLLLAIGHDVYLNYFSTPEKVMQSKQLRIDPEKFTMTDTGWIWTQYANGPYNMARETIDKKIWTNYIVPVLETYTILVAAVPLVIGIFLVVIQWLFGIGAYKHLNRFKVKKRSDSQDRPSVYAGDKVKKSSYSRK